MHSCESYADLCPNTIYQLPKSLGFPVPPALIITILCNHILQNVTENNIDSFEDDAIAVANERIVDSIRIVCDNEILECDTILAKLRYIFRIYS